MKKKRISDIIKEALFDLCKDYYGSTPSVKNLDLSDEHTYTWFLDYLSEKETGFIDSFEDDDGITHDIMELGGMEYDIYVKDGDILAKKGKFTWIIKAQEFEEIKDQFFVEEKESRDSRKAAYGIAEYGDYFN